MRCSRLALVVLASAWLASACKKTPEPVPAKPEPSSVASAAAPTVSEGALRLGTPIEANAERVALSEVAKSPSQYIGKTFATTGTVTAVCQHMGCWMELKDDAGEAHIKMAGHAFFVPKTASGRKARVLATLEKHDGAAKACDEHATDKVGVAAAENPGTKKPSTKKAGDGCREEAETQLGRPLAKLELVAQGVELM